MAHARVTAHARTTEQTHCTHLKLGDQRDRGEPHHEVFRLPHEPSVRGWSRTCGHRRCTRKKNDRSDQRAKHEHNPPLYSGALDAAPFARQKVHRGVGAPFALCAGKQASSSELRLNGSLPIRLQPCAVGRSAQRAYPRAGVSKLTVPITFHARVGAALARRPPVALCLAGCVAGDGGRGNETLENVFRGARESPAPGD